MKRGHNADERWRTLEVGGGALDKNVVVRQGLKKSRKAQNKPLVSFCISQACVAPEKNWDFAKIGA